VPTDVVHRLYRAFDIEDTIEAEVGRWIDAAIALRRR
jgi:hypothetical protein